MKALFAVLANDRALIVGDRQDVAVPLSEGVVDFVGYRNQVTINPVAEIDAQRVEGEAEDARHGQKPDPADLASDPGLADVLADLIAQWPRRSVTIVAVAEGEEIGAVAREQPKPLVEAVDLVEIEQQENSR